MTTAGTRVVFPVTAIVAVLAVGLATPAGAAEFTVGPDGTYQSLHTALADAIAHGDLIRTVKIQKNTVFIWASERVSFTFSGFLGAMEMRAGRSVSHAMEPMTISWLTRVS